MAWPDRPPRWRCGEAKCPKHRRWQPVSAMGEYDPIDAAMADLDSHYAREHPELVEEEVTPVERALAA